MLEHRMETGNPPFDEVLEMEDELRVTGHSPQSDVNEDFPLSHGWVPSHQQYSKGLHPLDTIGLSDDSRSSSDLTEMKTASPATALAAVTYETGAHSLSSHSPQTYHHTGIINSPSAINPACSPVSPLGCNDNNNNAPTDCQTMYYQTYDNSQTSVCTTNQQYESYQYYIPGHGYYQGSPDSSTGSYADNSPTGYDSEDSVELPNMATTCLQSSHNNIMYSQYNTGSLVYNNIPCMDKLDSDKSPNKRGRPCTFLKRSHQKHSALSKMSYMDPPADDDRDGSYNQNQRCKRGAKNILLWKFLLEELKLRRAHIKWENEQEGTFKFVDTTECSRRWGAMKKKADMNFEKLSRGIRHYYRDGLMSRKDGIRLVYKFNWEHVPLKYRPIGLIQGPYM